MFDLTGDQTKKQLARFIKLNTFGKLNEIYGLPK